MTSSLTADEADKRSQSRAAFNRRLLRYLTILILAVFAVLLYLTHVQQERLAEAVERQTEYVRASCLQRQANAIKTNNNWDALAAIERRNKFIDDDIRSSRVRVYAEAHLIVPTCTT